RGTIRSSQNLAQVPLPGGGIFRRLIETFHIHQATQIIINRGWPIIIRSEDRSGPEPIVCKCPISIRLSETKLIAPDTDGKDYNLRCTKTLERDTALTITHIPSKDITYAIFFGYPPKQVNAVLERLASASH